MISEMAKEKQTIQDSAPEDVTTQEVILPEATTETIEAAVPVIERNLKPGFIAIRHKTTGGEIAIAEKQWGTVFTNANWERLEGKKK